MYPSSASKDSSAGDALEGSTLYAMGLLDDAIREHLDLKRRRGADPEEIERLEREALGPVRRGPEAEARDLAREADLEHDDESEPDGDEGSAEESRANPDVHAGLGESSVHDKPRETQGPPEQQPEAPRAAAPPRAQKSPTRGAGDQTVK